VLVIIWEYRVSPGRGADFESFYGPDGPWHELFHQAPGFVSITLWRDRRETGRYLIADRWTSERLYEDFKQVRATDYQRLSDRGARLYQRETELGRFDSVD
jgi:heme-degrading monooxygenase HmoA